MLGTKVAKLALTGGPGVGKDTFTGILKKCHPHISLKVIRLAEPLYEVQHFIYKLCSKEIQKDAQDGILLNFLGKYMRSINPNVLLDHFARSVHEIEPFVDMIVCSDARPLDLAFIRQIGFTIVYIAADPSIALERRKKRGDLSLSNSSHQTEIGITEGMYDIQITNNGTIEDYEKSIDLFMDGFLAMST